MNRALIGAAKVANGGWRRACGVVPLLVIVGVGVALRAWPFGERSFWFDEAFSWRLASFPWRELFQRSALDNNPPLFYVLLKIWIACFGDSPAAMRSLSLLAGAAGCVGVYLMVVEAFREPGAIEAARRQWTGLFAAALIAVTTLQIRWGGEARMYALGAALAAFSTWLLLRALRAPLGARPSKTGQAAHSRAASAPVNCATTGEIIARVTTAAVSPLHAWAFYALAALAFMYTHTYALFSVVAQAVFALGYLFAEGRYDPATLFRGRRFRRAVVAFGLVAAGWLPWVPVLVRQNEQVQDAYWTPPLTRWSVPGICHQIFAD
ncbi:MAG TPA: glycosyltransferase family 39 protein, partial [Pirellulales bacterium]|nr:glycosyltransferase family 39 protein [Pirellulales bacterium]